MDPGFAAYLASNERLNPRQGLEAPFLDPTLLAAAVPKSIGALLALALRGYQRAGAEAILHGIDSPLLAATRLVNIRRLYALDQARALQEGDRTSLDSFLRLAKHPRIDTPFPDSNGQRVITSVLGKRG
jgi:hypothetical protein